MDTRQEEQIAKLIRFGWRRREGVSAWHPTKKGTAMVFEHPGNVCVLYPDGSIDRLMARRSAGRSIQWREGWVDPVQQMAERQRKGAALETINALARAVLDEVNKFNNRDLGERK